MTKCLNEIRLLGIVTTNPTTINEDPLGVKFKLATFKTFYSKKEQDYKKQTEFHLVKTWTRNAEFVLNRVSKGEKLFVAGEMHYYERTFDDGRMIQKPEVIADTIIQTERPNRANQTEGENQQENSESNSQQATDSVT